MLTSTWGAVHWAWTTDYDERRKGYTDSDKSQNSQELENGIHFSIERKEIICGVDLISTLHTRFHRWKFVISFWEGQPIKKLYFPFANSSSHFHICHCVQKGRIFSKMSHVGYKRILKRENNYRPINFSDCQIPLNTNFIFFICFSKVMAIGLCHTHLCHLQKISTKVGKTVNWQYIFLFSCL